MELFNDLKKWAAEKKFTAKPNTGDEWTECVQFDALFEKLDDLEAETSLLSQAKPLYAAEKTEQRLCELVDTLLYIPTKKELEGIDRQYTLGYRKEAYKQFIESEFKMLKKLIEAKIEK